MSEKSPFFEKRIKKLCNCGRWYQGYTSERYCPRCHSGENDGLDGIVHVRDQLRKKLREMYPNEKRRAM